MMFDDVLYDDVLLCRRAFTTATELPDTVCKVAICGGKGGSEVTIRYYYSMSILQQVEPLLVQ